MSHPSTHRCVSGVAVLPEQPESNSHCIGRCYLVKIVDNFPDDGGSECVIINELGGRKGEEDREGG